MNFSGDFLKRIDIFSNLDTEELRVIFSLMYQTEIQGGKILFHEGDAGDKLFIVASGKVAISVKLPDGSDLDITEINAGNFFGEMSIFENAPRSATCYTKEDSVLFSLQDSNFFDLMRMQPATAIKIMHRMLNITVQRLQRTGAFLSDMVTWGESARKRAITDELTGLFNRRFLDDALEEQFSRAKQNGQPLALVMVDLDHFGELNREYGQATGDNVILAVTPVFKSLFNEKAILARYGGDEFTFILPETEGEEAYKLCEKVCKELRALTILENLGGGVTRITSSIGVASFPENAQTLEALKGRADQALYRAKELGRDRAVLIKG
ncbi:MAG: GGDEF domain-containing protein [Spirochaetota bacterium]